MRTRKEIEKDVESATTKSGEAEYTDTEKLYTLQVEILLDIRDLLAPLAMLLQIASKLFLIPAKARSKAHADSITRVSE